MAKKIINNNLINKILLILFCLFYGLSNINSTTAEFSSFASNQNNIASAGCWVAPTAPILISPANDANTNATDVNFTWNSTISSCPIANISYRFQLDDANDFTSPLINTSFSSNLSYIYNNIPEGEYWWRVQAKDQFNNTSTSAIYHLVVDQTPPSFPSLSITGSFTKAVEEKLTNGDFETGNLTGWISAGNVQLTNNETIDNPTTTITPVDGNWMVRIGNPDDPGNWVWENRLMQSFDNGAKSLSLHYNFFSRDFLDEPGFFIRLNDQEIFKLNNLNSDGFTALNTGWQEFYYDLSNQTNSKVNLVIYAGNTGDTEIQSWVYIDKITTYFVSAPSHATYTLSGNDNPAGSGINHFQYKIDDGDWITGSTFGGTPPLSSNGEHTIQYYAVDNAGNQSQISIIRVITDDIPPSDISDLSVSSTTENSIVLTWTSPGNDGITRRASQYDIRYSSTTTDCSSFNFDLATKVGKIPLPQQAGETETLEIFGLNPKTKYCFAVKTADEAPNWSSLSNVILGETTAGLTVNPRDVVINELMWMGSSVSSADEWLELRNMTDHPIDLSNFSFTKFNGASEEPIDINLSGKTIPAHGYFLIANGNNYAGGDSQLNVAPDVWDSSLDLSDDNLQITLYWNDGTNDHIIDTAWDGNNPTEGLHDTTSSQEKYYSMERTSIPGDGTDPLNWYTCIDTASTTDFFDGGADERGTPKAANRSENEPFAHQALLKHPPTSAEPNLSPTSSPSPEIILQPEINLNVSNDYKLLSFTVNNLKNYIKLSYEITYESEQGTQGIIGEADLDNQDEYHKENIIFGTCSSGGTCIYHSKIHNIQLKITLEDKNHHLYNKTQLIN